MLSREEAEEVCAWNGWHWILKIQLEMFFGLKEEHICGNSFHVSDSSC
jgi:hypothetical protein